MPVLTDPLGWFTLEVPEAWSIDTEDGVSTLQSPAGGGTVFVSGGRHAGGRQQSFGGADFLARFLRSVGIDLSESELTSAQGPGCRIYRHEQTEKGVLWRYWSVTDDETALLITYTRREARTRGATAQALQEAAVVEALVRSVRLFHSAPVH